jgi:Glycosyltransferase family 9 (heptosyltransferase)
MQQSFPDVKVIAIGDHETMPFNYWAALWSLVPALGITLDNLPAPKRFLQTLEADVVKWRDRLASVVSPALTVPTGQRGSTMSESNSPPIKAHALPNAPIEEEETHAASAKLNIGLVWQGQFAGTDNQMADRSIPPRLVSRFVAEMTEKFPQITWVSLQHGAPPLVNANVIDWTGGTVEFTQMAELIDSLDLVICIDTGAAHLAAALGAKTWVLLREAGDWRYGINGDTCAWSPTMRLFRQDTSRRWQPVFAHVAEALRAES